MPLLAQLVVEYVADVSKLTSGVQAAAQAQDNMTSKANQGSSALLGFAAGAAAVATTAIVGISVASTKMAADFQSGMTSLVTGAGEAQSNIKQVSDGILKMATDTGTSTKSLTDGMYMIESAGFHGADGLNVLKMAAQGAKVGNAELKDVANGVTTALTDYHLTAEDATTVTNDLVATVASGKTSMGSLASSLKNILPVASSAGISLRDVSGAMATMTGEGVPAGQAANYLKTTVLALEAPSTKGAAALKNIGLSAQDVATEMKHSLPDALQMITDHLKKKIPEGSAAYTSALKDIRFPHVHIQR
jgi:TP901 family phage tail tape measure protein